MWRWLWSKRGIEHAMVSSPFGMQTIKLLYTFIIIIWVHGNYKFVYHEIIHLSLSTELEVIAYDSTSALYLLLFMTIYVQYFKIICLLWKKKKKDLKNTDMSKSIPKVNDRLFQHFSLGTSPSYCAWQIYFSVRRSCYLIKG